MGETKKLTAKEIYKVDKYTLHDLFGSQNITRKQDYYVCYVCGATVALIMRHLLFHNEESNV